MFAIVRYRPIRPGRAAAGQVERVAEGRDGLAAGPGDEVGQPVAAVVGVAGGDAVGQRHS